MQVTNNLYLATPFLKVKDYADQFKTAISTKHHEQTQNRTTTCFSMCRRSAESDLNDECLEEPPIILVGVLITKTLRYVS